MVKKIRNIILRVGVSVISLGFMFYTVRGEFVEALTHFHRLNWFFLASAVAVYFISLLIVTHRINIILVIQKIHLRFSRLYYLWVISSFFNLFLPSAVGGDIAKAYYIAKDSGKKIASVTSVLIDRFFGLMAVISIGFSAYLVGRNQVLDLKMGKILVWTVIIVFIFFLLVVSRRFSKPFKSLLLKFSPLRLKHHLERFFEAVDLFRDRRADLFSVYFFSLAAQAAFVMLVYILARSIRIDLPITLFFLFMPIITLVSMLPSIGGLGVREAATVYLFKNYVDLDQAVALSLIFDLFIYGIGIACGILYAIRGGASIQEIERIENTQ